MERNRTLTNRKLRKIRVRSRVRGTTDAPRLTVHISSRHVSAQIIDDSRSATLVASSSVGQKNLESNLMVRAQWVGREVAKKAKRGKISRVVLDRGQKRYHGRVAALVEAVRAEGIQV